MPDSSGTAAARRIAWRERLIGAAALLFGSPRGAALERWRAGLPVLLYHRILDAPGEDPFAVTATDFDAQVEWLRERYDLVTVGELWRRLSEAEGLERAPDRAPDRVSDRPTAAISFDDGYECTHRLALPILRQRGVPATLFVDTARLGGPSPALSVAQLRELAEGGFEIASHGVEHRLLTGLDRRELDAELRDSRVRLEEICDGAVEGFAPPFGRYDRQVVTAARDAGYRYLCTCRQHRTNPPGQADRFLIDRIEVNRGDDLRRLASKLDGRYARVYESWYRLNPTTRHWLEDPA